MSETPTPTKRGPNLAGGWLPIGVVAALLAACATGAVAWGKHGEKIDAAEKTIEKHSTELTEHDRLIVKIGTQLEALQQDTSEIKRAVTGAK